LKDHFLGLENIEQPSIEGFHFSGEKNARIQLLQIPTSYSSFSYKSLLSSIQCKWGKGEWGKKWK